MGEGGSEGPTKQPISLLREHACSGGTDTASTERNVRELRYGRSILRRFSCTSSNLFLRTLSPPVFGFRGNVFVRVNWVVVNAKCAENQPTRGDRLHVFLAFALTLKQFIHRTMLTARIITGPHFNSRHTKWEYIKQNIPTCLADFCWVTLLI